MPITNNDIVLKYSNPASVTYGGGNTTGGSPTTSKGGYISTTQVQPPVSGQNLFDDITGVENAAGQIDYRCVFVHNNYNGTITLRNAIAYIYYDTPGGATIALAADNVGASPVASNTQQASIIPDVYTAPTNINGTFVSPIMDNSGMPPSNAILLGDIPAGSCKALWIRRTAGTHTAITPDGVTIQIQGDTAA